MKWKALETDHFFIGLHEGNLRPLEGRARPICLLGWKLYCYVLIPYRFCGPFSLLQHSKGYLSLGSEVLGKLIQDKSWPLIRL